MSPIAGCRGGSPSTSSTLSSARSGTPGCGRGLGRIDVLAAAAYRLLNDAANWGISRDRRRVHVPISVDQAITLAPWYRDSIRPDGSITVDGEDEGTVRRSV